MSGQCDADGDFPSPGTLSGGGARARGRGRYVRVLMYCSLLVVQSMVASHSGTAGVLLDSAAVAQPPQNNNNKNNNTKTAQPKKQSTANHERCRNKGRWKHPKNGQPGA